MSDTKDEAKPEILEQSLVEEKSNLAHIDQARIVRLKAKGQYWAMYEHFDLLRTKFIYGEPMTGEEGIQLVTMTKYFMEHGHSESLKIVAKHIHAKYIQAQKL